MDSEYCVIRHSEIIFWRIIYMRISYDFHELHAYPSQMKFNYVIIRSVNLGTYVWMAAFHVN